MVGPMTGKGARLKGALFRRTIRNYLTAAGLDPIARSDGESGDDIVLVGRPQISIELKNHARLDLGIWMAQARANAKGRIAIVIFKRFGIDAQAYPQRQWVLLELSDLARLLRALPTSESFEGLGLIDIDGELSPGLERLADEVPLADDAGILAGIAAEVRHVGVDPNRGDFLDARLVPGPRVESRSHVPGVGVGAEHIGPDQEPCH